MVDSFDDPVEDSTKQTQVTQVSKYRKANVLKVVPKREIITSADPIAWSAALIYLVISEEIMGY